MKNAGIWLVIFGFGSMALNFFGYEFMLLMWVDNWGPMVGWSIRWAFVVVGIVLFMLGAREVQQTRKPA